MDKIKKIVVSDLLIEIYKNFNVVDQVENIRKLSDKEQYLLFIICLDKHDNKNSIVRYNFKPFESIVKGDLYNLQKSGESDNSIIVELQKETNYKFIDIDNLTDSSGNELPDPFGEQEVRDIKLDLLGN